MGQGWSCTKGGEVPHRDRYGNKRDGEDQRPSWGRKGRCRKTETGRNGQRQKRRKEYREKHTDEERAVGKQRKRGGGESEKWEMGKQPVREEAEKWPGVGTGSESS